MAEPNEGFDMWAGCQKTSLVKHREVTKGTFTPNEEVTDKWKSRYYEAKIISVGKSPN